MVERQTQAGKPPPYHIIGCGGADRILICGPLHFARREPAENEGSINIRGCRYIILASEEG
jgi:hypothetical protein